MAQNRLVAEVVQQFFRILHAVKLFAVCKGQLVGGALDVI